MTRDAVEPDVYFRSIEAHFVQSRGEPLVLSPKDWHLAAEWERRGIPLAVVIRAITSVFKTAAARGRSGPVSALAYCRHAVEAEHKSALAAAVGSGQVATPAATAPEVRLCQKAEQLDARAGEATGEASALLVQAAGTLRRVAATLETGQISPESAEMDLLAAERALLDGLFRSLPASGRQDLSARCAELLSGEQQRMSPEAWQRTLQHARDREVRRSLGLPRLSLLTD